MMSQPRWVYAATTLLLLLTPIEATAPKSSVYCTTTYGPHSHHGPVPTGHHSTVTTFTPRVVATSTPSTTITPTPTTTTVVSTATSTATQTTTETDTFSTTITSTTTITNTAATPTSTSTSTSTSTFTAATSTSTVPTTAGFIPIQSSVPDSSYSGSGGQPVLKRDTLSRQRRIAPAIPFRFNGSAQCSAYPQCVECTTSRTVTAHPTTYTVTASTTSTITKARITQTVHSTTTSTTTTTVNGVPASTTITTSTTVSTTTVTTPPPTTTTTVTTSVVTYVPATTVYAQCASNNFMDTLNGQFGVQINEPSGDNNFAVVSGPTDAPSCCALCADPSSNCGVASWDENDNNCYVSPGCTTEWQAFSESDPFVFFNGCEAVTPR